MSLPLKPPVLPQLARPRGALPSGDGWAYEPKWDGFRCIAFVDGDAVHLQSRNGRDLTRYFPEVRFAPGRYVLDGEIVIHGDGHEEFDLLGQRIHPAASRVAMLAEKTPATYIAFVDGDAVHLQSRNGRDLTRYFPELSFAGGRYVLDGEIVIHGESGGESRQKTRCGASGDDDRVRFARG